MNTTPDDRRDAVAGPVDWPVRPDCWDFAMDFLGDPEAPAVEAYVAGLEAEVERLRSEAADFHMAYRIKCDEETKAQAVEIGQLREALRTLWRAQDPDAWGAEFAVDVSRMCKA